MSFSALFGGVGVLFGGAIIAFIGLILTLAFNPIIGLIVILAGLFAMYKGFKLAYAGNADNLRNMGLTREG